MIGKTTELKEWINRYIKDESWKEIDERWLLFDDEEIIKHLLLLDDNDAIADLLIMNNNFPFAVVEMFTDLGTINPINFLHASVDQRIKAKHIRILRMLVKELAIIESLIMENTAYALESQPTLLELIKWQEQT